MFCNIVEQRRFDLLINFVKITNGKLGHPEATGTETRLTQNLA
jgi:hypothetical protein